MAGAAGKALAITTTWGINRDTIRRTEFTLIRLGSLMISTGRTSPIACRHESGDFYTVKLCYAGEARFRHGSFAMAATAGDALVFPHQGGVMTCLDLAGLAFQLERQRLQQVVAVMSRGACTLRADHPFVHDQRLTGGLFKLFSFIDMILAEDRAHVHSLGLDDLIYRKLALAFIRHQGDDALLKAALCEERRWSPALDSLVDYIRTHHARPLTLTDLEEQSAYSARQLQKLFRARFDCTPMQFLRRQRLEAALQRLLEAGDGVTIAQVARECGYPFRSNFSTDFRRQYGFSPSSLLRRPRSGD